MKKTFLQMISEIAPAPEALKNVGKELITVDGKKQIKGKYVTIIDPKTGEEKQIYKTTKGERSVAYKAAVAGYDKRYRKIIEKFQSDPAFKNQVSIIRKNNVFYLNRLYNLIKSQDPSIESLTQLFSKTKNDSEFFSHLNSFIVPLTSVWKISKKIEVGDLWDDENYKTDLNNNGFVLILPRNQTPTKFNVMVKWGINESANKVSLADFNKSMSSLVAYVQKFVDIEDKIMVKGSIVKKLLDPIAQPQGNNTRVYYNETQILNEIRDEKSFNELYDFLKLIQYKNDSKTPVIGPDTLNFSEVIKNIDVRISKLENERNVLNRDSKKYEDEIDNFKTLSQKSKILQDKLKDNDFIDQIDLLKSIITIPEAKIIEAQKTDKPIEVSVTTKVFVTKPLEDVYSRRRQAIGYDGGSGSAVALPFDVKFEDKIITITPDQIELYKFILRTLEDIKKGTSSNINADNLKQMIKNKIDTHFNKEKEKIKKYIDSIKTGTVDPKAKENLKKLEDLQEKLSELKVDEESRLKEYALDAQEYLKDLESLNNIKENLKNIENRRGGISNFINKISIVDGQIKSLESKKESYKNLGSNNSKIVKMLLSNKSIDSFEDIFEGKGLLQQINDIYTSLHVFESSYSGFSNDIKAIIDSSFILSKYENKRNNFIQNSRKVFKMIKDLEQFALMLKILKEKVNEAKDEEIKLSDKIMDYEDFNESGQSTKRSLTLSDLINKFSSSEMNIFLNRIVGIIISFKSMLRTIGFIKIYDGAQYHTLLDISEMNVDTDTNVDDYYVYVGIVPEDVISQSTFQFWTSCQTLSSPTELNQYVGSGTLLGNIVCFLLALDWSKPTGGNRMKVVKAPIKHSAITDPDDIMSIKEFKEKASEGIRGTKKVEIRKFLRSYAIRPVGRVLIKTFELDDMNRGVRTIKPETLMQGGTEEEIQTIKFVDRLYTNLKSTQAQSMTTSKGVARGDQYDKYTALFYKGIQSLAKRLNINVQVGNYKLREDIYNDGTNTKAFSSAIKKYESGQKINFSRETTQELLELLKQDKNFLRYRTFRHALFSKDIVDGTLDLQGTEIESLDPMHPTNLPKYGRGLSNDKFEDFNAIEWKVNDDFRKNSGNFETPLTKEEEAMYNQSIKIAEKDYQEYKLANPQLEL